MTTPQLDLFEVDMDVRAATIDTVWANIELQGLEPNALKALDWCGFANILGCDMNMKVITFNTRGLAKYRSRYIYTSN